MISIKKKGEGNFVFLRENKSLFMGKWILWSFFLLEKNGEILRRRNSIIVPFSSDANFHGEDQTSCTNTSHRSFLYVYFWFIIISIAIIIYLTLSIPKYFLLNTIRRLMDWLRYLTSHLEKREMLFFRWCCVVNHTFRQT